MPNNPQPPKSQTGSRKMTTKQTQDLATEDYLLRIMEKMGIEFKDSPNPPPEKSGKAEFSRAVKKAAKVIGKPLPEA